MRSSRESSSVEYGPESTKALRQDHTWWVTRVRRSLWMWGNTELLKDRAWNDSSTQRSEGENSGRKTEQEPPARQGETGVIHQHDAREVFQGWFRAGDTFGLPSVIATDGGRGVCCSHDQYLFLGFEQRLNVAAYRRNPACTCVLFELQGLQIF